MYKKYYILDFEYDNSQYKDTFKINVDTKELIVSENVSDEYYNKEDYGYYKGDEILAYNHAINTIVKLETSKSKSNRNKLLEQLKLDFKNYFDLCYKPENDQNKGITLIKALAYYSQYDFIYEYINQAYNNYLSRYNDEMFFINTSNLDYLSKALMEIGDYCLFVMGLPKTAIKFFKLSENNWSAKNKNDNEYKKEWMEYSSIYKGKQISFYDTEIQEIVLLYNKLVNNKENNIEKDNKSLLNKFKKISKDFLEEKQEYENGSKSYHNQKLVLFMVASLKRLFILEDLSNLLNDDTFKNKSKCINDNLEYLANTDCSILISYIKQNTGKINYLENLLSLLEAIKFTRNIKKQLLVSTINEEYAYYTTLNNLNYILPNAADNKDDIGKISIMNVSYMNDPSEGMILNDLLKLRKSSKKEKAKIPSVYLKSFTNQIDSLPMWSMYSNDGRGLCVVVDLKEMLNKYGNKLNIYKVAYVNDKGKDFEINAGENETINSRLKKDVESLVKITKDIKVDSYYLKEIIGNIAYLFKSSYYSYEEEIRMLYIDPFDVEYTNKKDIANGIVPMLYHKMEVPIIIKRLILGPKFEQTNKILPFLKKELDLMSRKTETKDIGIFMSDIKYR